MPLLKQPSSLVLFTIVTHLAAICRGDNIVFIHHLASYSHIIASQPLAEALVSRGHNVTYINAVVIDDPVPGVNYIVPDKLKEYMDAVRDMNMGISTRLENRVPNWMLEADIWNYIGCEALLQSSNFQSWLNSTPPVDLIYIDNVPECGFGIAHKLQAKLGIFLPLPINPQYFEALGLPTESSSIPLWSSLGYKTSMTFWERVKNTLAPLGWRLSQNYHWPRMQSLLREQLDIPDLPTRDEFYESLSLVLINGHFIDEHRRSLPPLFVNVPALHVKETHGPLPKELQEFIASKGPDGSKSDGFVYISLGTVAKAPKLPKDMLQMFFNTIQAFPNIRFLWRWDGEFPEQKPENLFLSKWFDQQDLLAHPKIRGFVTQAGRPSSQEAIYNAVPMITLPILGDQDYNSVLLEDLGVGINLEVREITEKKLTDAVAKILQDKRIKARSVEVSKLYKDLPMKPIDTAVWWTEYILRHKNTKHLKSLAINQTWYQRRLLDVWAFVAISIMAVTYLTFLIVRYIFKILSWYIFSTAVGEKKLKSQ